MTQYKPRGGGALIGYGGGKGGGGGRAAEESPDSLHSTQYARILDLISVGPTGGPYSGDVFGLRDVFLNGTPIQNDDGSINFPGVEVHYRLGTQNQDPIPGFPAAENTIAVGVELKATTPWAHQITNGDLSAVRVTLGTDRLTTQDTKNGDLDGGQIDYVIELSTDGGAFVQVLRAAMTGKTTQRYTRTHRVDLPPRATFWTLRVRRLTPDSSSSAVANRSYIDAVTEVVDAKLRYPMMAMVGYLIPAQLFSSIPTRAVRWKGREIRIPSNYDPVTRTYAGTWDGTFKSGVSSNPAWVLLDIWTNDIFGLGQRVDLGMIDRYALYRIAQYCDELVPDGLGGMEPRFRIVGQLRTRADARKLLQDIASAFHGMSYEMGGMVTTVADMPQDPVYTYSAANVVGEFNYTGTRRSTRYTVALVSYSNPDDFGRQKVEPVEDLEGIARYGVRETTVSTFLNVSRGQAVRMGKWVLLTSKEQTRGVNFTVGLDYAVAAPGRIVEIADNTLAGASIGGRIYAAVSQSEVVLDRIARVSVGDTLTLNLPAGVCEERVVSAVEVEAGRTRVHVATPYSELPQADAGWNVGAPDLKPLQFRVLNVRRKDKLLAEITAVEAVPGKHAAIDYGTKLDPLPSTVVPSLVMPPPTDVRVSAHTSVDQHRALHVLRIEWKGTTDAKFYQVQWRRNNGNWVAVPDTTELSVEVEGIRAGLYQARVRAVSPLDVRSAWVVSEPEQLEGDLAPPPAVSMLLTQSLIYGIRVNWGYPADSTSPIHHTEIWIGGSSAQPTQKLADVPWPQTMYELGGLPAGAQLWFWARGVDSLGESGPVYPAEGQPGVLGTVSTNAAEYLEAIKDLIVTTEQGKQLIADIERLQFDMSLVESLLGENDSVLTELSQKAIKLAQDIAAEASKRAEQNIKLADDLLAEQQERVAAVGAVADGLADEVAGRQQAVTQTRNELQAQIDALSADVAEVLGAQPYDAGTTYQTGNLVTYEGGLYRAKQATTGNPPSDATYWQKVGDYASLGEAVGDLSSRMVTVEGVAAGNTQRIEVAETTLGDQGSRLSTVETTTASQGERLTTVETKAGQNTSAITQLQQTDATRAQQIQQLQASDGQQNGRIEVVETAQANLAQRATVLEQKSADHESRIATTEEATADHAMRLLELRATQADTDGQLLEVNRVQAGQAMRLVQLAVESAAQKSRIRTVEDVAAGNTSRLVQLETTSGSQSAAIVQLQQTDAQHASQLNQLEASDESQSSSIQQLNTVTAATSQRVTEMQTQVDGQGSRLVTVEQTQANLVSRTDQLETVADEHTNKLTELSEATDQHALRLQELKATTADADGQITDLVRATATHTLRLQQMGVRQGELQARIVTEEQARIDGDEALAQRASQLESKTEQNASAISAESQARADADSAMAQDIATIQAQANSNASAIQTEAQARADADQANAQAIQTLQAEAGQTAAIVQQNSQAIATIDGKVSANWNVKVQANQNGQKYLAGISVGLEANGEGEVVDPTIAMLANRLVLLSDLNGQMVSPFSVVNGQVFMNQAFIGQGWIKNANIEDAAVTSAKIANAAVTSAKIQDAAITTAKIADATISTAKIGVAQIDTLRLASGSVVAGTSTGFSVWMGSSGDAMAPLGNVGVYLPYGGTLIVFLQVAVSGGAWTYRSPRVVASINGNPIVLDRTITYGTNGNNVVEGFSYIYGPVGPGSYFMWVDGQRPTDSGTTYAGRMAILGFQR